MYLLHIPTGTLAHDGKDDVIVNRVIINHRILISAFDVQIRTYESLESDKYTNDVQKMLVLFTIHCPQSTEVYNHRTVHRLQYLFVFCFANIRTQSIEFPSRKTVHNALKYTPRAIIAKEDTCKNERKRKCLSRSKPLRVPSEVEKAGVR